MAKPLFDRSTIWTCLLAILVGTPQAAAPQVPYERLVKAGSEPESWLTYNGDYSGRRYSGLDDITPENVASLRPAWVYQMQQTGIVETTPLVFDGLMILTEPPSTVTALDAATGRRLWTFEPTIVDNVKNIGFPPVNRGVAVLDETVFVGTLDAWLYALDLKSGAERWRTHVAENRLGHSITMAPLALDGKIIVGISGGEVGIRGFVDAYDAETGERVWRFWTIPEPGEPGNETWGGDSWQTGAGATWLTGVYDPELDLLYWGIGNPGPDWNGDVRPGDNLYTSSVVALDPSDGTLQWYFQYTPHDTHDWDSNQIPILVDAEVSGEAKKLLVHANRNAFYYVIDRSEGRFLTGVPYAKQTWAEGLTEAGRPIVLPNTEPSEDGTVVWPSLQGATNWFSPSYSPKTRMIYIPTRESGAKYYKREAEYEEGQPFMGGGQQAIDEAARGFIRALDVTTGEKRWDFELTGPPRGGVLSTAGGLVFGGSDEGNIYALNAENGKPLWRFQTGGAIRTNPMSFGFGGKQYIVTSGGGALFAFALP